jgi:hypothetical protein
LQPLIIRLGARFFADFAMRDPPFGFAAYAAPPKPHLGF